MDTIDRDIGVICNCNRSTYAKLPVIVGRGQSIMAELGGCFIGWCLYCNSRVFFDVVDGKVYRYSVPGQAFWDRITEIVREQYDSQLESPYYKLVPCQEDQKVR